PDLIAESVKALIRIQGKPLILHLAPERLDQVEFWRIGRQEDQVNSPIPPPRPLLLQFLSMVNASIVQHHHGKPVFRLLREELVKRLQHDIRCDFACRRMMDQLTLPAQEPQDVQTPAVRKRRKLHRVSSRTPCVGQLGVLGETGFIKVIQVDIAPRFPRLQLIQQALRVSKRRLVTALRKRMTRPLKTVPPFFLHSAPASGSRMSCAFPVPLSSAPLSLDG